MGEKITYDYFYGGQLEAFSFYRLPRVLVTGQQFRGLSTDAKLLYRCCWTEWACPPATVGMTNRGGCTSTTRWRRSRRI